METRDIRVMLHDIRSAHNVGSMFRTADAAGVGHIYCSGYTPTPLDRFKRPVKEIAKTALGAELTIAWEYVDDVILFLEKKKTEGFQIVAIEQDARAIDYKDIRDLDKAIILVGKEVEGLDARLRDLADIIVEIPMMGMKESLNVSVAFGICLYRICDR